MKNSLYPEHLTFFLLSINKKVTFCDFLLFHVYFFTLVKHNMNINSESVEQYVLMLYSRLHELVTQWKLF